MNRDLETIDVSKFSPLEEKNNDWSELNYTEHINEKDIIPLMEHIYIGNMSSGSKLQELLDENIECILYLAEKKKPQELLDWYDRENIMHLYIPIPNNTNFDISKHWDNLYHIISDHYGHQRNILIQDERCISRSITTILYWIIRESFETKAYIEFNKSGRILNFLLNKFRMVRPILCPNPGFMTQLREAEREFQQKYIKG